MTRLYRWFLIFLTISVAPVSAWAHPGHGAIESGPAHYLSSPIHAFPLAGCLLLMLLGAAVMVAGRARAAAKDSLG